MRKVYSLLFAAVATFAAVSCNKEVAPSENLVEDAVVFTAGFDEQTRTTINQEGKSLWEANDKITLHNGTKGYEFTADMAGRFVPFTYAGNDFAGDKFMAVYPAGEYTADVAAKTVTASVPMYQPSRSNTWSEGASLAVAFTEDDNLYFKNATAMVKFVVYGEKVKSVYFKGNDNEVVSGSVLVTLNSDNTVKSVVGTSEDADAKTAKLWANTGGDWDFEDNTTYYLAVIPQNFKNGFTVQAEVEDVEGLKDIVVYDKAYDLKPNTILNIGVVQGVEPTWAVAGKFNSWDTSANPMTREGAYYVLKGVKGLNPVEGYDDFGFKFVVNGTDWKGSVGEVAAGAWEYVWDAGNGSNIYVKDAAAETTYDIYVNPSEGDNGKFVVVPAGTPMPEDGSLTPDVPETPGVEGEASQWGIVGDVNGWGTPDVTMYNTATAGLFVAKNVQMPAGGFKIRANNEWNDAANYGPEIAGAVEVDHVYDLICGAGSNNMTLTAGTYDIWFDLTNKKVYVMTPGKSISEAVAGTIETPKVWYIVGNFNGWKPADAAYKMTVEGDCYVYDNFTAAAGCELKFAPGVWSGDKGGNKDFAADTWLNTGGDNISVEAGTYKIYLKNDQSQYKFEKK